MTTHGEDNAETSPADGQGSEDRHDPEADEPDSTRTGSRLNWLRAGVLGANDGIVSTGSIVVGVAGASTSGGSIVLAGVAGLFAGAMSMAAGEYVSVSGQHRRNSVSTPKS